MDGDVHDSQRGEVERQEKVLYEMEQKIIRFTNDKVVKSLSEIIERIKEFLMNEKRLDIVSPFRFILWILCARFSMLQMRLSTGH